MSKSYRNYEGKTDRSYRDGVPNQSHTDPNTGRRTKRPRPQRSRGHARRMNNALKRGDVSLYNAFSEIDE